jgi:hypothetical protein
MSVNVSPQQWGPKLWKALHYIAFGFPQQPDEQYKTAAQQLMSSLAYLLPCQKCRSHYSEYLKQNPPRIASRSDFMTYISELHNSVNERLGKEVVPTDETVAYTKTVNRGVSIGWVVLLVLLATLAVFFWQRK